MLARLGERGSSYKINPQNPIIGISLIPREWIWMKYLLFYRWKGLSTFTSCPTKCASSTR